MTLPVHKLIQQRRQQLGIGEGEIARRIGVSHMEYYDVEAYEDELTMVLPLKNARALAAILGFDLATLFGLDAPAPSQSANNKPRHVILVEARNRLGVSVKEVADGIGFDEIFVENIENNSEDLDACPYEVLRSVAQYLKLDPCDLLYAASA
jgi:transcriptional regulator with XRE-family HTH domain